MSEIGMSEIGMAGWGQVIGAMGHRDAAERIALREKMEAAIKERDEVVALLRRWVFPKGIVDETLAAETEKFFARFDNQEAK